jgi:hypothetical protein
VVGRIKEIALILADVFTVLLPMQQYQKIYCFSPTGIAASFDAIQVFDLLTASVSGKGDRKIAIYFRKLSAS